MNETNETQKINGCIFMISSRVKILKKCLDLLFRNYNCKFNYPVHIFHFDNIYSVKYIKDINKTISQNIFFHQLEYSIPDHIKEEDLFYNRKNIRYVNKCFGKERVGYLHAINWKYNFFKNEILQKYEFLHLIDDDSFFINPIQYSLFNFPDKYLMATSHTEKHISNNIRDVRIDLHKFVKYFINKYSYEIKNDQIKKYIENDCDDYIMKEFLEWNSGNCNIFNAKLFSDQRWSDWVEEVNKFGGSYKYRWGDIEITSLYCYLFLDHPIYNFNLVEKGLYQTGNCDWIRVGVAPSVKI